MEKNSVCMFLLLKPLLLPVKIRRPGSLGCLIMSNGMSALLRVAEGVSSIIVCEVLFSRLK